MPNGQTSACWRRLQEWQEAKVWLGAWQAFLGELDAQGQLEFSLYLWRQYRQGMGRFSLYLGKGCLGMCLAALPRGRSEKQIKGL